VVRLFWERVQARDWSGARALLADDFVAEWPHSRERFRGADTFIDMNRAYPEGWTITILRILADANTAVSEIRVDQSPEVFFAASFFELTPDARIARATEYWVTSPYEDPALWRAPWSEPLEV